MWSTMMCPWISARQICFAPDDGAGAGAAGAEGGEGGEGASAAAGAAADWTEGLSDAAKGIVTKNDFKSADAAVLAYDEANKLIGGPRERMAQIPEAAAVDAEWDAFYGRAGRPDQADGYEPAAREGADEAVDKEIAALAHKMGLNGRQFTQLREAHYGADEQGVAAYDAAIADAAQKTEAELAVKHGDLWPVKKEMATRAETYLTGGDGTLAAQIERAGLKANPLFMERMITIGEAVTGDGHLFGGGGGGTALSPQAAQAKIDAMNADPEKMKILTDRAHPAHKALIEERDRLFKQAHPEPGA